MITSFNTFDLIYIRQKNWNNLSGVQDWSLANVLKNKLQGERYVFHYIHTWTAPSEPTVIFTVTWAINHYKHTIIYRFPEQVGLGKNDTGSGLARFFRPECNATHNDDWIISHIRLPRAILLELFVTAAGLWALHKEPCAARTHTAADQTEVLSNRDIPEGADTTIRTVPIYPEPNHASCVGWHYLYVNQIYQTPHNIAEQTKIKA